VHVIPVLDVAGGQVVHARRGERAAYRPIVSPLVAGSDPLAVARALLFRAPAARALYLADLDALAGRTAQRAVVAALLEGEPGREIWLDAGFAHPHDAESLLATLGPSAARVRPVFGTESLRDAQALSAIALRPGAILSLDVRLGVPIDPAGAWHRPASWPATLVVMTLDRVGASAGPDLQTFARMRAQAPDREWIGAGGLQNRPDLAHAAEAGAAGWLVASALHAGTLDLR
jgi:phosphoribosylformimino-5-aminoimidazole carboxamide ribotide isomerase